MTSYHAPYSKTSISEMTLSTSQMQDNAIFIWGYMYNKYGWTLNATCGLIANAEAESTINPARPQNNAVNGQWYPSGPGYTGDAPNPTTTHYGLGLFQVTPFLALTGIKYNPYTYGNWALDNGYTFSYESGGTGGLMEPQLDWLMSGNPEKNYYNTADPDGNQRKWYQDSRSPLSAPTPGEYGKLTDSPELCAECFYWNFERSGNMNPGTRPEKARKWYDFLYGIAPPTPTPSKKQKMNFLLLAYASGVITNRRYK